MKKSVLFILALPLILGSCDISLNPTNPTTSGSQSGTQTQSGTTTGGDNQTGGQQQQGTEGSGTETTTGEGTTTDDKTSTDEGNTSGSGTTTGGGSTHEEDTPVHHDDSGTGGGGQDSGGGTTGGGTGTGGGQTQTSKTVSKYMADLGVANQKDVTEFDLASDLHVKCAQGSNKQNKPKYYTSDAALRLYGGNTITFTSPNNITKIQFSTSTETNNNELTPSTGSFNNNVWTGSAKSVTLTVFGSSGKYCIVSISATYNGSGTTTGGGTETGGGTTTGGGTETGGGTTTGGGSEQSGNGNTSSEWTTAWTGIQYDIAYSLFKGNLPCLKAFNGYAVGDIKGSAKMFFNPYIKGWSKESQTYYDGALKDMGYSKIDTDTDEDGVEWFYYQKGTYYVQTSHYRGDDGEYYFDVYAYNDYEAPFSLDYTPKVDLTTDVYPIKSSYKQYSKTINGITFACSWCTENSGYIQLAKESTMEITSSTALSKMDITFNYDKSCCLVYAGSSSGNAKIVYNNGNHWDLPSGTKYVKIQTLNSIVQIDCLSIL